MGAGVLESQESKINVARKASPRRREQALALLAETPIVPSNFAPPLFGIDIPPPHFMRFWQVSVFAGCFFAAAWALLMTAFWSYKSLPLRNSSLIVGALASGLLFGLGMGLYYAFGRRKYGLPSWQDLGDAPSSPS